LRFDLKGDKKYEKLFFPFFLTLLLLLQPLSAKPQSEVSAVKEADALFQAQDWEKAAKAYEALTKADPTIGRSWYRLGYSLHALGRYGQAIDAYKKAVEINQNPIAMYNLACAYSRNKENNQALDWLNKGVDAGFTQVNQIKADPDLAACRAIPDSNR
jgi:tetratricopeptide (TPR) repeat protein